MPKSFLKYQREEFKFIIAGILLISLLLIPFIIVGLATTIILFSILFAFAPIFIKIFKFFIPLQVQKETEHFFITNKDDWNLAVLYYPPKNINKAKTKPVILAHGIMVNHQCFHLTKETSLIEYLTNENYHVYAIDMRGCGYSYHTSKKKNVDFNFDDLLIDIELFIHNILNHYNKKMPKNKTESVHWIGHSLGALLMTCFLGVFPKKQKQVASFIAMSPPIDMNELNHTIFQELAFLYKIVGHAKVQLFFRLYSIFAGLVYTKFDSFLYNKNSISIQAMRRLFLYSINNIANGLCTQIVDFVKTGKMQSIDGKYSYQELTKKIKTPTFLLTGNMEYICPPYIIEKNYNDLPATKKKYSIFSKSSGYSDNYCHASVLFGKNAKKDIFSEIKTWLEKIK